MPFTECRTPQHWKLTQKKGSCTKVKGHISTIPLSCTPTLFGEHICTEPQTGSL